MATGLGTPGAPPPPPPGQATQKVSDVITAFRPSKKFKAPSSRTSITSLDFDDTGDLAVIARDDDTAQIYNCTLGKHAKDFNSQKYGIHLARFSHHAQNIIYASTKVDDSIRYVTTHDNSFIRYFKGHTDTVTSISLCPASDHFMSCAKDNTVRMWDLRSTSYQGMLNLQGAYLSCWDPSATVIAIASQAGHAILLYDARNYDKIPFATFDLADMQQRLGSGGGDWTKLEFTNDGKHLIISTTGKAHFVLDAFNGTLEHLCVRKRGHSGRLAPGAGLPMHGTNATNGAAPQALGQGDTCATPDGRYLIGGSGEEGLLVWDISKDSPPDKICHPEHLTGPGKAAIVGYNPKFNMLATADKDLVLWQPDPDIMMDMELAAAHTVDIPQRFKTE